MARLHTRSDGSLAVEQHPDPSHGSPAALAAWLDRHGGNGIERPLDHDLHAGVIRTEPSPGRSLRSLDLPPPDAAAVLVAVLETLIRLDTAGADHGALTPDVIRVDHTTVPPTVVLRGPAADDDPASGRDAAAVASIAAELLAGWRKDATPNLDRAWDQLADPAHPLPLRRAHTVARRLSPAPPEPTSESAPRRRGLALAATVAVVGLGAAPFVSTDGGGPGGGGGGGAVTGPEVVVDGTRYRVGRHGDQALGLPGCAAATIVVLRPDSGRIWLASVSPDDRHAEAPESVSVSVTPVAVVPGADRLEPLDCSRVRASGIAGSVVVPLSS